MGSYGERKMGKTTKKSFEGFRLTTNNRMELLAVIVGLEN
jgi:ribonuclease HI